MAERSKAPDSRVRLFPSLEYSGPRMWAWVRIPLLTMPFSCHFHFNYQIRHQYYQQNSLLVVNNNQHAHKQWKISIRRKSSPYFSWILSNGVHSCYHGELAQMVERSLSMREVRGSMPRFSMFIFSSENTLLVYTCRMVGTLAYMFMARFSMFLFFSKDGTLV